MFHFTAPDFSRQGPAFTFLHRLHLCGLGPCLLTALSAQGPLGVLQRFACSYDLLIFLLGFFLFPVDLWSFLCTLKSSLLSDTYVSPVLHACVYVFSSNFYAILCDMSFNFVYSVCFTEFKCQIYQSFMVCGVLISLCVVFLVCFVFCTLRNLFFPQDY